MKILAFESSGAIASVALADGDRTVAEFRADNGNTHSETLLPMADALLSVTGWSLSDIDLFAASVGPGSFTGIRISAATVKGLAFGSGKICIGVSSLAALAYNLRGTDGLICPVINARRRQVYTALFRSQNGNMERLLPDTVLPADELDALLLPFSESVRFCGDGYPLATGTVTHPAEPTPEALRAASAASVACAAYAAYRDGARGTDATLSPVYLRPCQAERERAERLQSDENSPKGTL